MSWSKDTITKPYIYIATNYSDYKVEHSAIDIALAIDDNPFISKIFTVEGLYDLASLKRLPQGAYQELAYIVTTELTMADIIIVDLRNGEPAELGYAVATNKIHVLYNPDRKAVSPVAYGKAVLEVDNLGKLGDINYLSVMLQSSQ